MKETIFRLESVSYSYPTSEKALSDVNLEVYEGERLAILGANGSGKSSMLHLMDGLYFPSSGKITAFGRELTEDALEDDDFRRFFRSRIQFMFQSSDAQLFCATVHDEIAFGPLQLGLSQDEVKQRITDCAELCNLNHLLHRPPHTLSGGEKKRVGLAAALAVNPSVLILDELTAGLDPRTERWFTELLMDLHKAGKTMILATHDLHQLPELADRAVIMSEEHKIVKIGTPQEILDDLDLLLEVNLIHVHTHEHGVITHAHPHLHDFSHEHEH